MLVTLKCKCGKTTRVNKQLAGRKITCPYCSATLSVPVAPPQPQAAPTKVTAKSKPKKESTVDVRFWITLLLVLVMLIGGVGLAIVYVLNNSPNSVAGGNDHSLNQGGADSTTTISKRPTTSNANFESTIRYEEKLWFVISDFRSKQLDEMLEFSMKYEFVQGNPIVGKYVWVVEATNTNQPESKVGSKPLETYIEFPFDAQSKQGTLKHIARSTHETGKWKAFLGLKAGKGKYEQVSAKLESGSVPTSREPPTPAELAGELARKLPIAVANARYDAGNPNWELLVDYQILKPVKTKSCYLVAAGIDDKRVEFEISSAMANAKKQGTIVVPKPKEKLRRPIVVYLETRNSGVKRIANPTPVR